MYGYLAAGVLALLIVVGCIGYSEGKQAGIAKCQSDRVEASGKAQEAIDLRDQRSADTRIDMLDLLRVTIPPIEIKTHETVERIRTVYKDRVVTADCAAAIARPASVRDEINAARERANAAASGLRLGTPVTDTPGAGMAGNRPMGRHDDGSVRDRGQSAERIKPLPVWLAGIGGY